MATAKKGPGRPADNSKSVVWCRIGNELIAALDEMAANMRPVPTRAALINLAIEEYVERNRGGRGDSSSASGRGKGAKR